MPQRRTIMAHNLEEPPKEKPPKEEVIPADGSKNELNDAAIEFGMIKAESEPRESLPVIGIPMRTKDARDPRFTQIPGVDAIEANQELGWNQLVFVRTSEHGPKGSRAMLETPYSGTRHRSETNEVDPRTTLHFAVNHHVLASPGGWGRKEELPFIIIIPAQNLIDQNGKPKNLADVDTFWNTNLELPNGTVILRTPDHEVLIPKEMTGKIHVVDRDLQRGAEEDTADIIKCLGFTPIKGGKLYSRTEGVSEAFNALVAREGLDSGSHQKDETNIFEARLSKLDNERLVETLRVLLDQKAPNPQASELLERRLGDILAADSAFIERFAKKNKIEIEKATRLFDQAKALIRDSLLE